MNTHFCLDYLFSILFAINFTGGLFMLISTHQVIPGCVLIDDVVGKTGQPLMPKDTVLTNQHITVLQKFLVPHVHISKRLQTGELFTPTIIEEQEEEHISLQEDGEMVSFFPHYIHVVESFKEMFQRWESQQPIDIPALRKLVIPLLERLDEVGSEVFTCYKYASKEDYFYHHSVAVGMLATYLSQIIGYKQGESFQIGLAGILSDCGMSKIDQDIRLKTGRLHEREMQEIKRHPMYSYRLIEKAPTLTQAVKVSVLQHHERLDGSGYPLGISDDNIHPYARIIAVCDVYHAMTCERLYKEGQSLFKVIDELLKEQFSKLDPQIVLTFIKQLINFSIGTTVQLSNNSRGEIVFIDDDEPTRPMVKLKDSGEIISLQDHPTLHIEKVFND